MSEWYYVLEGKVHGPLSEEDIHHAFSCGALSASTPVWHDGMIAWAEAHTSQSLQNVARTGEANAFSRPSSQSEGACQVSNPASNLTVSLQEPIPSSILVASSPVIAICSLNHVTESKKSFEPESEKLPQPVKIEASDEPAAAIPSNPDEVANANVQTWRALFSNRDLQIFACIVALIAVVVWHGHNRQLRPNGLKTVPHPAPSSDRAVTAQPRQLVMQPNVRTAAQQGGLSQSQRHSNSVNPTPLPLHTNTLPPAVGERIVGSREDSHAAFREFIAARKRQHLSSTTDGNAEGAVPSLSDSVSFITKQIDFKGIEFDVTNAFTLCSIGMREGLFTFCLSDIDPSSIATGHFPLSLGSARSSRNYYVRIYFSSDSPLGMRSRSWENQFRILGVHAVQFAFYDRESAVRTAKAIRHVVEIGGGKPLVEPSNWETPEDVLRYISTKAQKAQLSNYSLSAKGTRVSWTLEDAKQGTIKVTSHLMVEERIGQLIREETFSVLKGSLSSIKYRLDDDGGSVQFTSSSKRSPTIVVKVLNEHDGIAVGRAIFWLLKHYGGKEELF